MIKKIEKALRNPSILILFLLNLKLFRFLEDSIYLKIKFRLLIGEKLNLDEPKSFNEKIQWLKLFDRKPIYSMLVDKFEVRRYISKVIGEEHLIPLLGVWKNFEDIDFEILPEKFVLKPNHTSGNIYICKDKTKINLKILKKEVNSWLKREYYWYHREWCYKNIEPLILCEEYLVDHSNTGLIDYKLMCFNGQVKCSFVGLNRNSKTGLNIDFYDVDWNLMPFERHYSRSNTAIPKPKSYEQMVNFAEKISKNMIFTRIDFYEVDGHVYFGEITLFPGSGFEEFTPIKYDYLLGSWIDFYNKEFEKVD